MGNVLLEGTRKGDPAQQYQRWLQQNPDLVGKEILSENKLFRTSSYKFNGRNMIIKVFFKRDQSPLTEYLKIFDYFSSMAEKYKTTNIVPYKLFSDKDNQSFVVAYRQKMLQTLEDVLSAKPSPNQLKKKWIIYQMLKAVQTVHKHFNFYHGHIRTSNFVLTSYGYLMLTDFALYKPLYMVEDSEEGLPEFRLFYGSSVNNCTLAPEKITEQSELKNKERSPAKVFANYQPPQITSLSSSFLYSDGSSSLPSTISNSVPLDQSIPPTNLTMSLLKPETQQTRQRTHETLDLGKYPINYYDQMYYLQKMDIFSLGCSILQVLRDGKPMMNFETYLRFKKNEVSFDAVVEETCRNFKHGDEIKAILMAMLSRSPDERPSIEKIVDDFNKIIDTNSYSLIWHCCSAFSTTSFFLPDERIILVHSIFKFIEHEERGALLDFKISPPKCFQSFEPLKIFKSILKNKIIHSDSIPENSILNKILQFNQKQDIVQSEEQEIMNEDSDTRKEFFVPIMNKKMSSSLKSSTLSVPKLEKVLCPPEWNKNIMKLIQSKYKGMRLSPIQILKNRFQDILDQYKKSQSIRDMRLRQSSLFYNDYNMVISIVYSCIRSCKYNSSKLIAIEIIMAIAKQSDDGVKLTTMVPLLISLLDDPDLVTCKYAFNCLVDVFYLFVDPFKNEEDTHYYEIIIEMFVNSVKTPRLRINLFRRLPEIYKICQWLEIHIKILCKKVEIKNDLRKLVEAIKNNFGSYASQEIRELMMSIPDVMWPDMFEFFISFLNTEKILGLEKGISITRIDVESHKKIIDVIDSCIQTGLDQNGISLYYAIKYFTCRKISLPVIVKKIAPMIIHPHLWVRDQARLYLQMCLHENPPSRVFFLFREVFQPPFPLQPKDIIDNILLPQPLLDAEVDFNKRKLSEARKIGLTENLFLEYLQKVKASKGYTITKDVEIQQWNSSIKVLMQQKVQPISFNLMIKKAIYQLYEANFLYYVGNVKSPFKPTIRQEEKKKAYEQLHDALKKMNITSLQQNQVAYEKKDLFISLATIVNSTFQKLLTRFMKQDKTNKIRISESIYLILDTLYKFQQFNIKQVVKLGDYSNKIMAETDRTVLRPRGSLMTQIYEHKDVVTCLENIADKFLISGSYDGTARVFNIKKIEENITCQSEGTYEINSDNVEDKVRINSLAAFENTYTVAAATNKGNIRVFQIERMRGKVNRTSRAENSTQLLKYYVGGQIQKILTFKNENRNDCFCFVTGEGILGVQDIRMRTKTMTCNLGKQRGLPKSLAFSNLGPSIIVGTLDGYVLTYDIRCNLVSNIRQLQYEGSPVSITGIYQSPYIHESRNLFAFTYPSKNYEFSYFDLYNDSSEFAAEKHYTSCDKDDIISVPTMLNKTSEENFKLCNNSLTQKTYYKQLADFNKNFKILGYLSDPFTIKQAKIRQIWMDRCKHRYNQIYSIYNKKSLPFLQHLQAGVLTNMNPCIANPAEKSSARNLSVLVEKMETREYYQSDKLVSCRPPNSKIYTFADEQNADYLTCCKTFTNMVIVGGWDSVIKIYK